MDQCRSERVGRRSGAPLLAVALVLGTVAVDAQPAAADAGMTVVKDAQVTEVEPGDTITYTLTITNTGDETLTEVAVEDLRAVCEQPESDTIAVGADPVELTCTHVASAADLGAYTNIATVTSTQTAPVESNPMEVEVAYPPHGFSDVTPDDFFDDAVAWAKFFELVAGFNDNTYRDDVAVTRGQIVNMLWHQVDEPTGFAHHGFVDVPPNAFYRLGLNWAKARGLVTGFSGNRYRPNLAVTRAQLVNMLWRMVGSPCCSPPSGYTDVPPFFRSSVNWAKEHGIVGDIAPLPLFRPGRNANRGEVASVLYSLAGARRAWAGWIRPPVSTWRFDDATPIIDNRQFIPSRTRIRVGEPVRWANLDDVAHTVTEDAPEPTFDGGLPAGSGEFEIVFLTAGVFDYICTIHLGMSGRVTVT